MYQYYIFDFDNTLCDSFIASQLTYKEVFRHFNIPYNDNDIMTFLGESLEETYRKYSVFVPSFSNFADYFFEISDKIMPNNVQMINSAIELLFTLKLLGKKIAIVTSKNKSTLSLILKKFNIYDLFDCIIAYEDTKYHKPHPEGIELCIKLLGVEDKQTVVYIGDSNNDKKAGLSAGINSIGVTIIGEVNPDFEVTDFRSISLPLFLSYILTNEVNKKNEVQAFSNDLNTIIDRVVSTKRKFRKGSRPTNEYLNNLNIKVQKAVSKQEPIAFSIPFGAYKGWQVDAGDYPDWAEIFHLSYIYAYAQDIANVYEPGVIINYTYQNNLISHISNRSHTVNKDYTDIFTKLLKTFSSFCNKIQFRLVAINELYSSEEAYYGEFIDNLFGILVDFLSNILDVENSKIPYDDFFTLAIQGNYEDAIALVHKSNASAFSKFQSGLNNYCISGYNKDTNFSKKSNQEKVVRSIISALMIEAVDSLSLRRNYNKYSKNIQIVFDKRPTNSLFLGVTRNSVKSFWAGKGVLLSVDNKIASTIISQKEWINIKNGQAVKLNGDSIARYYKINYIPIELPISVLCNNYSYITVLSSFTQ